MTDPDPDAPKRRKARKSKPSAAAKQATATDPAMSETPEPSISPSKRSTSVTPPQVEAPAGSRKRPAPPSVEPPKPANEPSKAAPSSPPPSPPPSQASPKPPGPPVMSADERRIEQAHHIVQRHVYWSMAAGVLPLPLFDMVVLTGVLLKMIFALSKHYGVPYREDVARRALTSLLASAGGIGVGGLIGASLAKTIPVIGQSLGIVSVSTVTGLLTHAVGRTFVMHFESGGTLLDFDAKALHEHFRREFAKADQ